MDISNNTLNIIREKIKELGNKKLFDIIEVRKDDGFIEIEFILGYVDIAIDDFDYDAFVNIYYDIQKDKIGIALEEHVIYCEYRGINNITLINFCYKNLDKIKAIIKEALEVK